MPFARTLFALALLGLGIIGFVAREFAYVWQPAPSWCAGSTVLAFASNALLLACGAGILGSRIRARAALLSGFYSLASMLLVHLPDIIAKPGDDNRWFNLGEVAIVFAGAWILFADASRSSASHASRALLGSGWRDAVASARGLRIPRALFALSLFPIGISHFVYADVTAGLVPAFLPAHFALAYLTGACHLAAGLGILLGILPRLSATMEALMIGSFVLIIHVPGVVRAPRDLDQWTEGLVASAIGSVALLVGCSLRDSAWLAGVDPRHG